MKRIVIIGATSAIAEHCARIWVQGQAVDLTLVGRDIARTERVAVDLKVRSPHSEIRALKADFLDPVAIQAVVESIVVQGSVDTVLIAHGYLPDQFACQSDLTACRDALDVNGISPVLFAEAFATQMSIAGQGVLVLIGSVAGDKGRKSNYVYGAAKGLVTRYAQGLQHRFAGSGVKIVLIKPGPTDTPMTAHMKSHGIKLASVEGVAMRIVDSIERGHAIVYVPGKWKFIMWVIRHMPAIVFNKLNI